ncbi:hypothetical protein AWN65_08170 [Flavobacterium covae]|nr:hypothetical protein AWN65_08170 [Flavobacterium covae]
MITITPITDHEVYKVNGKEIFKNSYGNWFAPVELTTQERKAFEIYKTNVIENKNFKKHTRATYKS